MNFEIGFVNLKKANLIPAYDLEVSGSTYIFRTPCIPWCRYALEEMIVTLCENNRVYMYSPDAPNFRYTFACLPADAEHLINLYLETLPQ